MSTDLAETGRRRRPGWVWVITIFYVFSAGWTILSYLLIFSGAIPVTPAQQEYFASLGLFDYVSLLGGSLLTLTATVLLFKMRKLAVPLFGAAFLLGLGLTALQPVLNPTWLQAMNGPARIGVVIGLGLSLGVYAYARHLEKVGVLK